MELARFSGSLIETQDLNYALLMKHYFPILFPVNGGSGELIEGKTYTIRILNQTREIFGLPMDTFGGQFKGTKTYSLIEGTGHSPIDPFFLMSLTGMSVENFRKQYVDTHKTVLIDACIFLRK